MPAATKSIQILWVDDEIDLLKPHIIFLESKGYMLHTVNNGTDAVDLVAEQNYDLIFLDENMPGISGLETLALIKDTKSFIPVIMITKSEEEYIMDEAIGSKIDDYLIKPVNPNQILMSIKKVMDQKRLIGQKTTANYQAEFSALGSKIAAAGNAAEWSDIYRKLVFWELELEQNKSQGMEQVLSMQKEDANKGFAKFVSKNYEQWVSGSDEDAPTLSNNLFKRELFPLLDKEERLVTFVIDNLRFDQWKVLEPLISDFYKVEKEDLFMSILPTATQYARNAMFAGLLPGQIQEHFPQFWVNEGEEGGKNQFEGDLMASQMQRLGIEGKMYYDKVQNLEKGRKMLNSLPQIQSSKLSVIVVNFVDMLSHARTEMDMIKELAYEEPAYRSLTVSWFEHSTLFELIKLLAGKGIKIAITTDHGTIRVQNPIKVAGDKQLSTNLRYKQGKHMSYNDRDVFEIDKPEAFGLPRLNVSTKYIFAKNHDFMAYPNNYNHYVSYYRNTFQHGGVSMEEMLIPFIVLAAK